MKVLVKEKQNGKDDLGNLFRTDEKRFRNAFLPDIRSANQNQLCGRLIFLTHSMEKGFSNDGFEIGHGFGRAELLVEILSVYRDKKFDENQKAVENTLSALKELYDRHKGSEYEEKVTNIFGKWKDEILKCKSKIAGEEIIHISSKKENKTKNFADLAKNRYAVRSYADKKVDVELIKNAIKIATKTPSACNRQPIKVYIIKDKPVIEKILKVQGGIESYDTPPMLLLLTANDNYYVGINERNQGYVDGGLFAMSLLYALEFEGLAACALHTMFEAERDLKIRGMMGVPENEKLITFISVGHFQEENRVCKSFRYDVEEIIENVDELEEVEIVEKRIPGEVRVIKKEEGLLWEIRRRLRLRSRIKRLIYLTMRKTKSLITKIRRKVKLEIAKLEDKSGVKPEKRILDNKLYVGSGVEELLDKNIKTRLDEFGQYVPDYSKASRKDIAEIVLNSNASPSISELAQKFFAKIKNIKFDKNLGYYLNLYCGSVRVGDFREKGSSGGGVSWLASKLLDLGEIDGFIHVKKSKTKGVLFEYAISRSQEEIQEGAKSKYYPVELSKVLAEVKKTAGNYAVVGIPEIIAELRLLAEKDEVIKKRIKFYFGLVCGHQKTTKYAEAIAWEYGIKPGDLTDIDFRVKNKTGRAIDYKMKICGKVNGEEKEYLVNNREPFISNWAHGFFKAKFSDFTDDSFNELADVTFGDAWLPEYDNDPQGNNILIVRNEKLAEIISQAVESKELKFNQASVEKIEESQRGLIHHTRDELGFRLFNEQVENGWAPKKRVAPDFGLDDHRKKVQIARMNIAKNSHKFYQEAVERDDFSYFKDKMLPCVNEYRRLYGEPKLPAVKMMPEDGAILTLTGFFNYGNILQRYALQEFLRQNGYNFISLKHHRKDIRITYERSLRVNLLKPLRAVKRFLRGQRPYWHNPTWHELFGVESSHLIDFMNNRIKTRVFNSGDIYRRYIVGSDQVWRDWWDGKEKLPTYYFFDFLRGREKINGEKIKRISYAASLGNDKIENVMGEDLIETVRPLIDKFDAVSVREKSGAKLVKETWKIDDVTTVLDPVLLLTTDDYSRLIDKTDVKFTKIQPIFSYILDENPAISKFISDIQDKRKQAITKIRAHRGSDKQLAPIELWVKGFRDAELAITNSFHGMMLAILFNTDFIIMGREEGGLSRIAGFLKEYGLEDRLADEDNISEFSFDKVKPIDWQKINEKLARDKKRSGDWLLEAVSADK